jgi:glycine/D-amino acid oxidase-like deaminating enzyme
MDLVTGTPFWKHLDGQPRAYPPLRDEVSCEVLVIGGGISGALVAHALVEAGIQTVLVDRRDVGTGSTAASTALLQYEPDMPLWRLARLRGEADAVRCYRVCRDTLADIRTLSRSLAACPDPAFSAHESLKLASRPRDVGALRRECELRRTHGFDVAFVEGAQLRRETSLRHAGALLTREAASMDAFAFTHALLKRSEALGLQVFERTVVTSVSHRARTHLVHTHDRPAIRARSIVVAAGYEAAGLLGRTWGSLHSTYALATLPVSTFDGWPDDRLLWETARPYFYARRTVDDRIIVGGYDEEFRDPKARDALLPAKTAALLRKLRSLFPSIECETGYAWTGTFAETPDSLPYIGLVPGRDRVYAALGYGGNGIVFSRISAGIIRDQILGRHNPHADLFRFER